MDNNNTRIKFLEEMIKEKDKEIKRLQEDNAYLQREIEALSLVEAEIQKLETDAQIIQDAEFAKMVFINQA